jgi:CO dehydrogenase/acetyl-CoA synthase alpha subunit
MEKINNQLTPVITCTQNACNSDLDLQGAMKHAENGEEKYRY